MNKLPTHPLESEETDSWLGFGTLSDSVGGARWSLACIKGCSFAECLTRHWVKNWVVNEQERCRISTAAETIFPGLHNKTMPLT